MATSDGVHTYRLYFEVRDDKDQRKTQTQTLCVTGPLAIRKEQEPSFERM